MTEKEMMELAEVICHAGIDWNEYIDECYESGAEPYISYDEFLAQSVLEAGYRKEREERAKGCSLCGKTLYFRTTQYALPMLAPLTEAQALRDRLVDLTGEVYAEIDAVFCPVCGRKLKEEPNAE